MTKDDIARIIYARRHPVTKKEARLMVIRIFNKFTDELVKNGRLSIDGLGEFKVKTRPARRFHNPALGVMQTSPEKQFIKFYPVSVLKERVQKTDTVSA